MPTLKELNEELDAFNATLSEDNEDTPETLAEQERLLNAIIAAEAADLPSLLAKQLTHHFQKRAPGQSLPKGLSKASLIARIEALPPLPPAPSPEATPTPAAASTDAAADFTVAGWAKANGKDGREVRKALRALGLRAPYTLAQVEGDCMKKTIDGREWIRVKKKWESGPLIVWRTPKSLKWEAWPAHGKEVTMRAAARAAVHAAAHASRYGASVPGSDDLRQWSLERRTLNAARRR